MLKAKKIFILSSLLFLTCHPNYVFCESPPSAQVNESQIIKNISIQLEGSDLDSSFDSMLILEKLKTKVGSSFSQSVFDEDLKMLFTQYDQVDSEIIPSKNGLNIVIKLSQYSRIATIEWIGNKAFKSKALKKELDVKEGEIFNRYEFNKKFNKLKEYYIKKGYFESQLSYTFKQVPKTNQVAIVISILEGRSGVIESLVLNGFTPEQEKKIHELIYTKKYNLFLSWFKGTGRVQEEALEQDRLIILNLLQNEGYADAKIDIQVTDSLKNPSLLVITVNAEHGPLYRYGQITFKGNTIFSGEVLERLFLIHPGDPYSPENIYKTTEAIREFYGKKGYIDTKVQSEVQLLEDGSIYNVTFEIEESLKYKIGFIHVTGNKNTTTEVILRESKLVPGELFNTTRLKISQLRLQNIGYFQKVSVYPVKSGDESLEGENYRDIYIEVEEKGTGHASLFFGLNATQSIFGGLDIYETNFNIGGFAKLFRDGLGAFRGGGQFAQARVQIGSKERVYLLTWMTPYFLDTSWRFGSDIYLNHSQLQSKSYQINSYGGSLFADYPLSPYWTLGTKYRLKYARVDLSPAMIEEDVPASEPEVNKLIKKSPLTPTNARHGIVSAISTSLKYDSTDRIIKPTKGLRSSLEVEYAGLGGSFDFLKYSYVNNYYQQLWSRGFIKYRWEARFIQPLRKTPTPESIPLSERFFIGGENSVRGFRPFCLGPLFDKQIDYDTPNPMGGIGYALGSVEYLHEINSLLDVFGFIDAGSISLQKFHLSKVYMSYGFGIRLEVLPNIPLTLGVGFPVNPDQKNQVKKQFFSLGMQF